MVMLRRNHGGGHVSDKKSGWCRTCLGIQFMAGAEADGLDNSDALRLYLASIDEIKQRLNYKRRQMNAVLKGEPYVPLIPIVDRMKEWSGEDDDEVEDDEFF